MCSEDEVAGRGNSFMRSRRRNRICSRFLSILMVVMIAVAMVPAAGLAAEQRAGDVAGGAGEVAGGREAGGLIEKNVEIYNVPGKGKRIRSLTDPGLEEYDSREMPWFEGIRVKNQYNTDICWAFATTTVAEISYAKENYERTGNAGHRELSPAHLAYFMNARVADPLGLTKDDKYNCSNWTKVGGMYEDAMLHLSTYSGPGLEANTPFSASVTNATAYDSSLAYNDCATLQNGVLMHDPGKAMMKAMVYEYGAVAVPINSSYLNTSDGSGKVAVYDRKNDNTNHAVVVVGWDDNYSKDNFTGTAVPETDGAWIVMNSWGTGKHENGYFYLSYESYAGSNGTVLALDMQPEDTYAYNYQYDGSINYYEPFAEDGGEDYYVMGGGDAAANVYTAQKAIKLDAVGFTEYNNGKTDYRVEIRTGLRPGDPPTKGVLRSSMDFSTETPGFKTIKLSKPVMVFASDTYSIVIRCKGTTYFGVEYGWTSPPEDLVKVCNATADDESFVSRDGGAWTDMNKLPDNPRCFRIKGLANRAYEVRYEDGFGKVLSRTLVSMHGSVAGPAALSKSGYKFLGWDRSSSDVTGDMVVKAKWRKLLTNPLTVKGKYAKLKYKKLRKKALIIKKAKAFKISKAKGKVTYKLYSVSKNGKTKKKFKKCFKVGKTGNIKVAKGLKKGLYRVKVKVKAAGNSYYKPSTLRTVTVRVRVR